MIGKAITDYIEQDVPALAARQHSPEGVSVMVVRPAHVSEAALTDELLTVAARTLAKDLYPGTKLTGRVLMIERDGIGPGQTEVVLEVA